MNRSAHALNSRGDAIEVRDGRIGARSLEEACLFERIVARAPEQWTTLLFPIWDDEEGE